MYVEAMKIHLGLDELSVHQHDWTNVPHIGSYIWAGECHNDVTAEGMWVDNDSDTKDDMTEIV